MELIKGSELWCKAFKIKGIVTEVTTDKVVVCFRQEDREATKQPKDELYSVFNMKGDITCTYPLSLVSIFFTFENICRKRRK